MDEWVGWSLIAKFLFGDCTEEEAGRVQAWLEADPRRESLLVELEEMVEKTKKPRPGRDVDALWQQLDRQIERREARQEHRGASKSNGRSPTHPTFRSGTSEDGGRARQERADRTRRRRRRPSSKRFVRRAAAPVLAILCAVFVVVWLRGEGQFGRAESEAKVFATERGQRATIRLTDGTLVRLNAASSITVSPSFGAERRLVRLEGEAYFEVARDTTRPFVVRADRATTRVLGTAFDMSAYPGDDRVRVAVAEGKVAFKANSPAGGKAAAEDREAEGVAGEDSEGRQPAAPPSNGGARPSSIEGEGLETEPGSQGLVLTARQVATLEPAGRIARSDSAPDRYLAWMKGDLSFNDASFRDVVRQVERWYDVEVVVEAPAMPPGHLNARFPERESLGEVLNVIAATFDLRYEWSEKTVRFYSEALTSPE